jgi:ParB family chromosome partitioning protein
MSMAEPQSGRRGLGRGLSALLGEADPPPVGAAGSAAQAVATNEVPIELLRRNPDQPRRLFDEAELDDLSRSIAEKGVLQPILARPAPGAVGEFQIVAGERRWRAAQRAGLHTVPVVVRELNDLEVLEIGIIENIQRTDLGPLEEAAGYKALIERFGRTQDSVAASVGKSRSHIANMLRLLNLPQSVQTYLSEGKLTAGHARAVATAPNPETLAEMIVQRGLSVRQAEDLARKAADRPEPKARKARSSQDADTAALEQDLSEALGLSVELIDRAGRGELRIRYESLDQLDEVCRRLNRA